VISLEHHAERELDVKVRITELDGKPFDFLVTVTGDIADEVRLRSLIDLYKLAGKSYTLKLEYVYFSEFTDFACEDLTVTYTAEFTDFACEDNRRLMISATITNKEDRYWILELAAESEVKSMLTVSGHIVLQSGAPGTFNLKIKKGKLSVEHLFGSDQSDPPHAIIENIDPASDEYYDYCINPNNQ
jgi:hypothetical protein